MIKIADLHYCLPSRRETLSGIGFDLPPGSFLALLGENGAGKTTLLDILMGFRLRTSGTALVLGQDPGLDLGETRSRIAYLSEKIDSPGDWSAAEFLDFHGAFYPRYDRSEERDLMGALHVSPQELVGNLSSGELRRLQIVAALAAQPDLVIADEITAVLDIRGRVKFLDMLQERQKSRGMTVIMATNIPEGLDSYADHILLIHKGAQVAFFLLSDFVRGSPGLARSVLASLEKNDP